MTSRCSKTLNAIVGASGVLWCAIAVIAIIHTIDRAKFTNAAQAIPSKMAFVQHIKHPSAYRQVFAHIVMPQHINQSVIFAMPRMGYHGLRTSSLLCMVSDGFFALV